VQNGAPRVVVRVKSEVVANSAYGCAQPRGRWELGVVSSREAPSAARCSWRSLGATDCRSHGVRGPRLQSESRSLAPMFATIDFRQAQGIPAVLSRRAQRLRDALLRTGYVCAHCGFRCFRVIRP